jgi:hypothetical protein
VSLRTEIIQINTNFTNVLIVGFVKNLYDFLRSDYIICIRNETHYEKDIDINCRHNNMRIQRGGAGRDVAAGFGGTAHCRYAEKRFQIEG